MALAGVAGMAATALLTAWPEWVRLRPHFGAPGYSPFVLLNEASLPHKFAVVAGLLMAFIGYCVATRARPIGSQPGPSLLRGTSDNFGHADWLTMPRARKLFPGPDPAYGGLVVGEAYRVDQDRAAKRGPFDPADKRSWGMGGRAPLLGVTPQNGQDSTVGGTDREHGHAAAAMGRLAAVPRSGLKPSGPRLASAPQR